MNLSQFDAAALLENLHTGVVIHNSETEITYINAKALELLRLTRNQALRKGAFDPNWQFLDKYSQILPLENFPVNQVIKTKKPVTNLELGIIDSSNKKITWILCNASPEFDENQKLQQVVVSFIDITHQKKAISFEDIVELANDVIVVTESSPISESGPKIVYVNKAFTALTGYTKAEVLGKTPRILQGPNTSAETTYKIRTALAQKSPVKAEILNYSKAGKEYWLDMNIVPLKNEFGEVFYFAAIERDVTEQKEREKLLKELSVKDPLTSLLNRRGFFESAQASLYYAKRNAKPVSIAMIDIDHFKKINDNYGHDVGDQALVYFSKKIQQFFRDSDIIGRLGGEEFCILLTDANLFFAREKLEAFCESIKYHTITTNTHEKVNFTISVGLTDCLQDNDYDLDTMLKQADKRLYQAKDAGRNQVCFP